MISFGELEGQSHRGGHEIPVELEQLTFSCSRDFEGDSAEADCELDEVEVLMGPELLTVTAEGEASATATATIEILNSGSGQSWRVVFEQIVADNSVYGPSSASCPSPPGCRQWIATEAFEPV